MRRRWMRLPAALCTVAVLISACGSDGDAGGDDGTQATMTEETAADEPEETAAEEETAADEEMETEATEAEEPMEEEPAEEEAASGDQVMADLGLPVLAGSTFTSTEDVDGETAHGGWVDAPPPPNYAQQVDPASGWEVVDVQYGSEATTLHNLDLALCAWFFANYEDPSAATFWFWFLTASAEEQDECAEMGFVAMLDAFGPPNGP